MDTNDFTNQTKGFFGNSGEIESFHLFALSHIIPIILLIGIIYLIYKYKDKLKQWKYESDLRKIFGITMIICEMSYFWRLLYTGGNVRDHLPITVCGLSVILLGFCLMTGYKKLFEITYFPVFSLCIFALITPTVITYTGPMYYRYYQFFFEHLSLFIASTYLIFVCDYRPTWKSLFKSYICLVCLSILAFIVNEKFIGANYLFMTLNKEAGASVLDFLPSGSLFARMSSMVVLSSILYVIPYLPWYFKDKKKKNLSTI